MDKAKTNNALSEKANKYLEKLDHNEIPMGKVKAIAKEVKRDHKLAIELWSTGKYYPRLFSTLIMDKKELNQAVIETMMEDLFSHNEKDALRISEWLLANQLTKGKNTINLLESYQHHTIPMLRRLFWYYQARLRWTGKTGYANTSQLVKDLEADFDKEEPIVQWSMNFLAAWIGVFDKEYRDRIVKLGEKVGLYTDEVAVRGCTPNYLPEFIRIEAEKKGL